jgi:WD40 repeat protein
VTIDLSNTAHIWNGADGKPLSEIEYLAPIYAFAWNPDGTRLALGTNDTELPIFPFPIGDE